MHMNTQNTQTGIIFSVFRLRFVVLDQVSHEPYNQFFLPLGANVLTGLARDSLGTLKTGSTSVRGCGTETGCFGGAMGWCLGAGQRLFDLAGVGPSLE